MNQGLRSRSERRPPGRWASSLARSRATPRRPRQGRAARIHQQKKNWIALNLGRRLGRSTRRRSPTMRWISTEALPDLVRDEIGRCPFGAHVALVDASSPRGRCSANSAPVAMRLHVPAPSRACVLDRRGFGGYHRCFQPELESDRRKASSATSAGALLVPCRGAARASRESPAPRARCVRAAHCGGASARALVVIRARGARLRSVASSLADLTGEHGLHDREQHGLGAARLAPTRRRFRLHGLG